MVVMLRNARMLVGGALLGGKESDEWEGTYASELAGSEFDARRFEIVRLR
jgi:hypothetical protein